MPLPVCFRVCPNWKSSRERVSRCRPPFPFPVPAVTELAGVAAGLYPALPLLRRHLFGFMSSFYFIVFVKFGLLATTATPTPPMSAISLAPLFLGAAPLCPSGTNRSTHPERRLARSVRFCISKAPSSFHAASDPFIYVFSPFCCSPASSDSAAFHFRSYSDSSTTAANLRRSPDPPTTSGYNHHLSPTFVNNLAGLDNVGNVPIEATPAHQGLYGDKLYRVDLLPSPTTARSCVDVRLVPPPVTHRSSSISSVFQCSTYLRFSLGFNESYGYRYGNIGVLFLSLTSAPTPPLKISKNILSPPMSTLPHLITDLNARPHNPHRKDVDALLQSFGLIKSFYFWYDNAKVQRLGSVKTSVLSSHLIIFSVSVKVNSTSKSKLSIGSTIDAHEPKVQFIHLFLLVIVCLGKSMFAITSNEPITVTMSLFSSVTASFALPDEVS
ncbi:hypothetical protein YC2023_059814 [Brassica napus]